MLDNYVAGRSVGTQIAFSTWTAYVNEILIVSNEEVAQNASFVEIPQRDHVLNAFHGGDVHVSDLHPGLEPKLLREGEEGMEGGKRKEMTANL